MARKKLASEFHVWYLGCYFTIFFPFFAGEFSLSVSTHASTCLTPLLHIVPRSKAGISTTRSFALRPFSSFIFPFAGLTERENKKFN